MSNDCHANRWQLPGNATEGMGPNLGFSYLRSNPRTRALMEMWLDCQHTEQAWDQSCFKMVRHRARTKLAERPERASKHFKTCPH